MGAHRRTRRAWTHGALAATSAAALVLATLQMTGASAATSSPAPPPDFRAKACPAGSTPSAGFTDTQGSAFAAQIDCIAAYGVTHGKTAKTYAPLDNVIRQQMAQFLYNLAATSNRGAPLGGYPCQFQDISQVQPASERDAICADADAGITHGTTATTFNPAGVVSRDQMATFIVNTLRYEGIVLTAPSGQDYFDDDNNDSAHESDINALASVGIVQGKSPGRYDPSAPVTRGEMAAYMARSLEYGMEHGAASSRFGTGPGPVASGSVTGTTGSTFTQGGNTYTYDSGDTYELFSSATSTCSSDTYNDFSARLSGGDSVSGTYNPSGASTFCLHDVAPAPPASVTTAADAAAGGVTVTFQDSPTPSVAGYRVYRATATPPPASGGTSYSCPAYTAVPGDSPQTPPTDPWALVGFVSDSSPNAQGSEVYAFSDPKAQGQANPLQANQYCYVVSSVDGTGQTGTGRAATQNKDGGVAGAATPQGTTAAPTFASLTEQSESTFVATYDSAISASSCAADDFTVAYTDLVQREHPMTIKSASCDNGGTGGVGEVTLIFDGNVPAVPGNTVRVSAKNGADDNTVCSSSGTSCQPVGDTASTMVQRVAPAMASVSVTSPTTLQIAYNEYVAAGTVQAADYAVTLKASPSDTATATVPVTSAAATSASSRFVNVALGSAVPAGATVTVKIATPTTADRDTVCTPAEVGNCESSSDSRGATAPATFPRSTPQRSALARLPAVTLARRLT